MSAPSVATSAPKSCTECPKCGKYSIVHPRDEVYRCLNCDFEKVLSSAKPDKKEDTPLSLVVSSLVFILTLLLFL